MCGSTSVPAGIRRCEMDNSKRSGFVRPSLFVWIIPTAMFWVAFGIGLWMVFR